MKFYDKHLSISMHYDLTINTIIYVAMNDILDKLKLIVPFEHTLDPSSQ